MTLSEKNSDLKDLAKVRLAGNYTGAVLLLLMCSSMTLIFSQTASGITLSVEKTLCRMMGLAAANTPVLICSFLLMLVASALCEILQIGLTLYFLKISCKQPVAFFDLFYGYQNQMGTCFWVCAVKVLLQNLCLLPVSIGLTLFQRDGYVEPNVLVYLTIAIAVLLIIYIPIYLGLSQCYFLILDFPEYSAKKIMRTSFKIMKGNKRKLFSLMASLALVYILNLLSFGVATLWVQSYLKTTYSLFYLDIMKD